MDSTAFSEVRTEGGQLVQFEGRPESMKQISELLEKDVHRIWPPTTGHVHVSHGGYGRNTRYDINQHKYAGGGPGEGSGGYIEVLEIKNPPDNRCGVVIHEYCMYRGSSVTEWETLEAALHAYDKNWTSKDTAETFPKLPGFKRRVAGGALTPWFYAIGDQQLIGDFAFPEGLQDDPVYRFGKQFIVLDDDVPSIKTCMGTRFIEVDNEYHPGQKNRYRMIYWDDGSLWSERSSRTLPRPLEDGEMWITKAIEQFRLILAGQTTEFTINFLDGNKFVGKFKPANSTMKHAAGDYLLVVNCKGKKPETGWVHSFKPTPESPNIISHVTRKLTEKGEVVQRIEIKQSRAATGGKKWSGVFFNRSSLS